MADINKINSTLPYNIGSSATVAGGIKFQSHDTGATNINYIYSSRINLDTEASGGGSTTLVGLADVYDFTPVNNDILEYSTASGGWIGLQPNIPNGYLQLDSSGNIPATSTMRRNTASTLASVVPSYGEPIYESDTGRFVIGDGVTTVKNLLPPSNNLIGQISGFNIPNSDTVLGDFVLPVATAATSRDTLIVDAYITAYSVSSRQEWHQQYRLLLQSYAGTQWDEVVWSKMATTSGLASYADAAWGLRVSGTQLRTHVFGSPSGDTTFQAKFYQRERLTF
jgi:hypothetical protein